MKAERDTVCIGIAGLGGYAAIVRQQIQNVEAADGSVRLVAVCEPDLKRHAAVADELRAAGVTVLEEFDDLLKQPIDGVWLPLPIDLHAAYTIRALEAGKAVLCEKPAAGCVDDVDAMIAARDRTKLPVMIGYQDIYDPTIPFVKRMLLDGELGVLRRASVYASWARGDNYFSRNDWAGCFRKRGVWVLDSPVNNAMSHYVNLPLFLLGRSLEQSADVERIEAELYRTWPIENFDTASIRATLRDGVQLTIAMTHAVSSSEGPVIRIEGDKGRMEIVHSEVRIEREEGETVVHPRQRDRQTMVRRFADLIRGRANDKVAVATLETARAPVAVACGAVQAAPIRPIPDSVVDQPQETDAEGRTIRYRAVRGLAEAVARSASEGKTLHELGVLDWTAAASTIDMRGYTHFAGPASPTEPAGVKA